MLTLRMLRYLNDDRPTLGVIMLGNQPFCALELPWLDNMRRKSCIPEGRYSCEIVNTAKFGECVLIKDVPERDGVLIHSGNTVADTQGCIIVGLTAQPEFNSVGQSKSAMRLLLSILKADNAKGECILDIVNG